jgi:ABC-type amino acid transport substrate-binding protein
MKFLDTEEKLKIINSDKFDTSEIFIDKKCLDLSEFNFSRYLNQTIQVHKNKKPILYLIHYNGDIDYLLFDEITAEVVEQETKEQDVKFDEYIWQPREEISSQLAIQMKDQAKLLNKFSVNKYFDIQIKIGDNIIYDMIIGKD